MYLAGKLSLIWPQFEKVRQIRCNSGESANDSGFQDQEGKGMDADMANLNYNSSKFELQLV
jgi:hypothetical protein